jgi:hypothetical protein
MLFIFNQQRKNTRYYIHGTNIKCVWGYCNCVKECMVTWGSFLGHADPNIRSLQSHAAARLFLWEEDNKSHYHVSQMSLGGQPAPLLSMILPKCIRPLNPNTFIY